MRPQPFCWIWAWVDKTVITLTAINDLIEACVAEFNLAFLQKAKEERMEEMHNGNVSETR